MSTSVSSLSTNFFPSAENGFTTTTSGSVSSGAATVGLNSVAGYTNGEVAVFVIDPTDAAKKQTFTGVIDTSGVQVTDVVWTAGTNQTHALGATVVDYATATHISMMTKGILVHADQDGTLKAGAVDVAGVLATGVVTTPKLSTELQKGWENAYGATTFPAPDTITNNGNRSYDLVFNSVDLTGSVSNGMRLKLTRTVTAPTQCTDLESGSSQYYSKTTPAGMTFTDDFTCMAWIKLESYGASQYIISRHDGTKGWYFRVNSDGTIILNGTHTTGPAIDSVASSQSVPLGKWVHVAASLDISGTSGLVYIDGALVPSTYTNGAQSSLTQAGDLNVGALNGGTGPFDGKIAQVAVFSAVLSAATIRSYMSQTLSGSETSLVSAYSFNNSITDLNTTNANNLTANGSAVATATDSPFGIQADGTTAGTTEYAIITKTAFSTNTTLTVQVPEGNAIPTSGGVSAVSYSTQKVPYGFPASASKWFVETLQRVTTTQAAPVNSTWYNLGNQLSIPTGDWSVEYSGTIRSDDAAASMNVFATLSTANNSESDDRFTVLATGSYTGSTASDLGVPAYRVQPLNLTSQTLYYANLKQTSGDDNLSITATATGAFYIKASLSYL